MKNHPCFGIFFTWFRICTIKKPQKNQKRRINKTRCNGINLYKAFSKCISNASFLNPLSYQTFVNINITKHTVITKYCTVLLSDIKYMYYYIFKIQNNIGGIQQSLSLSLSEVTYMYQGSLKVGLDTMLAFTSLTVNILHWRKKIPQGIYIITGLRHHQRCL